MEYLKGLKKNIVLADYTTYKIGGPADCFFVAKDQKSLIEALQFAENNDLSIFILAGGSNILFSDEGFRGLVIKIENREYQFTGLELLSGAGVPISDLVNASVAKSLAGLEWAGGLPGSLGGAVLGNAGCFGREIKDIIKEVTTVSFNGDLKTYQKDGCAFKYRHSIFKENQEIIWNVVLRLEDGDLGELKKAVFSHIKYRQERHPLEFPNCGSVFKNCPLDIVPRSVQEKFADKIKNDPFPILPAAVLIDVCGLKGVTVGGAKISEKHPNFIINFNQAKAPDVMELIEIVRDKVKKEFNVALLEEIKCAGF